MRAVDRQLAQGDWQTETKTPVPLACPLRVKSQFVRKDGTSCSGHKRALPACCPPTPLSSDALHSAAVSQFPERACDFQPHRHRCKF